MTTVARPARADPRRSERRPSLRARALPASPALPELGTNPQAEPQPAQPQQKESAPAETEALDELTAEESAWIAKWLDRSPDWSAEKWDRMGNALGVKFS